MIEYLKVLELFSEIPCTCTAYGAFPMQYVVSIMIEAILP